MSLFSLSPCLSYSFSLKGHKRQEPSVSPSLFFTSFFGPAKRDVMLIDNLLNALPCFKGGRDMLLLRIQTKMRLSIRIISIRATMNHSLAVSFVANKPLLLSHIFIEPYGYVQECRFFVYIKSVKPNINCLFSQLLRSPLDASSIESSLAVYEDTPALAALSSGAPDGGLEVLTGVFKHLVVVGSWLQPHSRYAHRVCISQDLDSHLWRRHDREGRLGRHREVGGGCHCGV